MVREPSTAPVRHVGWMSSPMASDRAARVSASGSSSSHSSVTQRSAARMTAWVRWVGAGLTAPHARPDSFASACHAVRPQQRLPHGFGAWGSLRTASSREAPTFSAIATDQPRSEP